MSTSISQLRRRPTSPLRTAFVLAGGGNQAVCQVGMLKALFERDIVPDVLVGTSAGACNASVIANMPNLAGVERLVETWASLRGEEVFPGGRLSRAWNLLTRDDHLFDNEGLRALIAKGDTPKTFDQLKVPLRVVACDLDTGRGGGVRRRTARARAPGEHRASRACSRRSATTVASWSTAPSSTRCRCRTRSPVRSTASTC